MSASLLCVTGLSPQVVTETVYAIAAGPHRAGFPLPDAIHVATTAEGGKRIQLHLLDSPELGGRGQFRRLCEDYGLDRSRIRFDESTIHVIGDDDGAPLADITTDDHNRAAADALINLVRELSQQPGSLHVSLAGGRKTMGFFAGYALSLYGRPQDRLSHVLVNAPFESHPEFFYPPPTPRTLLLPGRNELASTADARVKLSDIPFVRLRGGLDPALLEGRRSFNEVVTAAQAAVDDPLLELNFLRNEFRTAGQQITLTDTFRLWMFWMARRVLGGAGPVAFDEAGAEDLLDAAQELDSAPVAEVEQALISLRRDNDRNYFDRNRSRLNKHLRATLSPVLARRYEIHNLGRRTRSVYGLLLEPHQIRLRR